MKKIIVSAFVVLAFSGCGVGSILELPFKVIGGVVDIIDPVGAVSGSIGTLGSTINTAIPF